MTLSLFHEGYLNTRIKSWNGPSHFIDRANQISVTEYNQIGGTGKEYQLM
jgi:hypothetical protein